MPMKKNLATIDNNEMVNSYENKKLRELLPLMITHVLIFTEYPYHSGWELLPVLVEAKLV